MRYSREWFKVCAGTSNDLNWVIDVVRREMGQRRVLHFTNIVPNGEPLDFWHRVGEALGRPTDVNEDGITGESKTVGAPWADVRFEPDRSDSFRYHNVGQPLHSDSAYHPESGDLVIFYMARQAASGGSSLFVDTDTLAAIAQEEEPTLLDALMTIPVRFGKPGNPGRVVPILRYEASTLKINWNYYRVLPDQGDTIARLREGFRAFLERLVASDRVVEFTVRDGEAVLFKDEEVLHGRRGYAAQKSGDRLLWKSYFREFYAR
jgi:alpha-ketoglutarate-dependent taurine dioxygenase